jgi:hypothetical protein
MISLTRRGVLGALAKLEEPHAGNLYPLVQDLNRRGHAWEWFARWL